MIQRFGAAARAGFKHTEFMFAGASGYEVEASEVRTELEAHGLTHVLLNAPAGKWDDGERGTGGLPGREADFQKSIEYGLCYASIIGAPRMHVMAGLASAGAQEETLIERLRWASSVAQEAGVTLCVEPLNPKDFPGYLVPNYATAQRIIKAVDSPQVKLQLDLYHYAMAEGVTDAEGLRRAITQLLPGAAHVQIANPPGRNEPGVGEIDYPPLLQFLDELGYDGAVGCEFKPSTPTTEAALGWAQPYLGGA